MLKGLAFSRTVMSVLEIGRHPMTLFTISLCTRKPTHCSCVSSFPLKYTLWSPSVGISPDLFHLISHNPRIFYLYRSISCKNSSPLPAALRVLTFHLAMVMFSLPGSLSPVTHVVPALVSDGERGRCAGTRLIRYGYSIVRSCHWWCVLGMSLVRWCPRLSRLQVCVEIPFSRRLSFWT